MKYDHKAVEKKWAVKWVEDGINEAKDGKDKKSYILIEFPYPSGERLHVGHARSYSCMDSVARKRRMQGQNVLFPMGWDAFGLPAENYAIKTGIHPSITTAQNIANAREQAISWGLSFDWSREVNTTDPNYYKWTQWIFIKLFNNGLAYKAEIPVNWCPKDKINLANEEVIDGKCERCGTPVERRVQAQWLLRITEYADRLLKDLDTVDYRADIKLQQVNWIGRKEGAVIKFQIQNSKIQTNPKHQVPKEIEVFTTRLDTIFGVTFLVLSPEVAKEFMDLVPQERKNEVEEYIRASLNKSEEERLKEEKTKTGVDTGLKAVNPANNEEVPVFVGDYVLKDYGTGAVMGVPGHDERDFEFANKYGLKVRHVIERQVDMEKSDWYTSKNKLVDSGKYTGLEFEDAVKAMIADGLGKVEVTYHLRDWVFSRQHYWGEPIPMIYCEKCAKEGKGTLIGAERSRLISKQSVEWSAGWYAVDEGDLPVKLPQIEKYQPTDTGESPLANEKDWVNVKCPGCGSRAKRETDTMPNWAGSSWYYLRYCDVQNNKELASKETLENWLPVDWYNGGMEHTTLHLLYSRFWHKFLFDLGVVPTAEPYAKRSSHGVVLGPDGRRMSKSRGNVINPGEIVEKFGADTLRLYEMFIGPFDQMVVWNDDAVAGVYRFLTRVWDLSMEVIESGRKDSDKSVKQKISKLIKKLEEDLEATKFNTAVSACMEFVNYWSVHKESIGRESVIDFVKALAPMTPFITEEIWSVMQETETSNHEIANWSIHKQSWPMVDESLLDEDVVEIVVQVNGRMRDKMAISRPELSEDRVKQLTYESDKVKMWLDGKKLIKEVYVPGKLINFVVE